MSVTNIFFILLQLIFAIYISLPVLLLLVYGFSKLFKIGPLTARKKNYLDKNFDFAIIITAHQEGAFITPLVDSILKQSYVKYNVYIVADDCDIAGLEFRDERVMLLKPATPLHSKIKSIDYAITSFRIGHDAVLILDADNLIHPSFLAVMNSYFRKGYKVVQADFKPKNIDTDYARMDAIGDMYNFFVEREARMYIGVSSAIWGSGIAVDLPLYKEVKYTSFLGGFDKKLQSYLVLRVSHIAFASEATLYDEKIATGNSLETQRTRWISSYFKYFGESWRIFFNGLKKGSFNLAYFGFIALRPPLFIVLGVCVIFTIIDFFVNSSHFYIWLTLLLFFCLSFFLIVIMKGRNISFVMTIFKLPLFILRQMLALLKIKNAKKEFLKTKHTKLLYIDDLLRGVQNSADKVPIES